MDVNCKLTGWLKQKMAEELFLINLETLFLFFKGQEMSFLFSARHVKNPDNLISFPSSWQARIKLFGGEMTLSVAPLRNEIRRKIHKFLL